MLSWGENVPEVVATLTLARAGQGTMALAACFAGPMFNLAVSGAMLLGLRAGGQSIARHVHGMHDASEACWLLASRIPPSSGGAWNAQCAEFVH